MADVVNGEALDTFACTAYPNLGRCTHTRCGLRERNALAVAVADVTRDAALLGSDLSSERERRTVAQERCSTLAAERDILRGAMFEAARVFDEYAERHARKGTQEGEAKARANRSLADVMRAAINIGRVVTPSALEDPRPDSPPSSTDIAAYPCANPWRKLRIKRTDCGECPSCVARSTRTPAAPAGVEL